MKSLALAVQDILHGVRNSKTGHSPDSDHDPFREDFSSAGWDLLLQINVPNMKSLGSPVTNGGAKCRNGVVWGSYGALEVMGNAAVR